MTAQLIRSYQVTVPAGTTEADPQVTDLTMPPFVVVEIDIVVPPGPRGELGFALWASGKTVIPEQTGAWMVSDNEVIRWPLIDQITSGGWQLAAYNNGQYDHTLYIRFQVVPVAVDTSALGTQPIAMSQLSS